MASEGVSNAHGKLLPLKTSHCAVCSRDEAPIFVCGEEAEVDSTCQYTGEQEEAQRGRHSRVGLADCVTSARIPVPSSSYSPVDACVDCERKGLLSWRTTQRGKVSRAQGIAI